MKPPMLKCPHCGKNIATRVVRKAGARALNAMRRKRAPGAGRPKSIDRCPCGQFTRQRALQRRHVCEVEVSV